MPAADAEQTPTDLPPGYGLAEDHIVDPRTAWGLQITGGLLALVAIGLAAVTQDTGLRAGPVELVRRHASPWLVPLGAGLALPFHELAHGLVMQALGGRPRYGAKIAAKVMPVLYATCKSPFTRGQYAAITLAPTVGLNAVLLAAMLVCPAAGLLFLSMLALSTAGAVGDWWIAFRVLRLPRGSWIQDHPTEPGFRELAPDKLADESPAP